MVIKKSSGVTPTEQLLADLCEQTFLKLWSYPNLYKDDGKEFCDVLVVFEDHALIFFDRENRQLEKMDKDPLIAWQRWKRSVIDNQVQTAKGAERYLRTGRPLYLDKDLTVPFPIPINRETVVVHKIIVAHGASEACKNWSAENVTGSLGITYGPPGAGDPVPFMVDIDKNDPIHIFDTHNLPIVLSELDTAYDFTKYLDEKIRAINSLMMICYAGEEDLLAHYFRNFDKKRYVHFIGVKDPTVNALMLAEGDWGEFVASAAYQRKKKADEGSYLIDDLIQTTGQNALDGRLQGTADVLGGESAIKELAKEPRFFRRALAARWTNAIQSFPEARTPLMRHVSYYPSFSDGKGYVFLQLHVETPGDYEAEYRPARREILKIACGVTRNKFPHLKKVVGLAIDAPSRDSPRNSEDFLLLNCESWTDELRLHFEAANEDWKFFETENMRWGHSRVSEFPPPARSVSTQPTDKRKLRAARRGKGGISRDRDALCSCGSGRPFRKCHKGVR